MNEELGAAEAKFRPRFAEAEAIQDENERRVRIEGLRNSFGTKQSMIRKKYGVRLRERRTKAEIAAERERLGLRRAERERAKAVSIGTQQQDQHQGQQRAPLFVEPMVPHSTPVSSGWTAANTPKPNAVWEEHDAKRRRMNEMGVYQTPSRPGADDASSRKTLSVTEIGGGLSGTAATAAVHDPTLPPSIPAAEQMAAPAPASDTAASRSSTVNIASSEANDADDADQMTGIEQAPAGADLEPITVDDDSDSSDGGDDIPSEFPSDVRETLMPH